MFSQLTDGFWILLYGMAGIFVVMGVIISSVLILARFGKAETEEE